MMANPHDSDAVKVRGGGTNIAVSRERLLVFIWVTSIDGDLLLLATNSMILEGKSIVRSRHKHSTRTFVRQQRQQVAHEDQKYAYKFR